MCEVRVGGDVVVYGGEGRWGCSGMCEVRVGGDVVVCVR